MTLHIYGPTSHNSIAVLAWCPTHQKRERATVTSYYDHWGIGFRCGASVDASEKTWIPDARGPVSSKRHKNTGRRRIITPAQWEHWHPHIRGWMRRIPAERYWAAAARKTEREL